MNQYGTQILSPDFLEQGLQKSYTSLEVDFLDKRSYSKLQKKYLAQAPTMVEGLQFHSSTQ